MLADLVTASSQSLEHGVCPLIGCHLTSLGSMKRPMFCVGSFNTPVNRGNKMFRKAAEGVKQFLAAFRTLLSQPHYSHSELGFARSSGLAGMTVGTVQFSRASSFSTRCDPLVLQR